MTYTQKGEQRNTGRTHFKKGMFPWNKGKKGVMPTPWNAGRNVIKNCLECGVEFNVPFCRKEKAKFCSMKCLGVANGRRVVGNKFSLGKKHTPEWKSLMKEVMSGSKNHKWKGNEVGYRSLHTWIERMLGKPNQCSCCGKVGYGRQIHWSNVSGEYKRDISDWQRLCAKCHREFDLARI